MEVNRVFMHGDCHADFRWLKYFCEEEKTNKDDLMIILGDSGINYWASTRDYVLKEHLAENHDMSAEKTDEILKTLKAKGLTYEPRNGLVRLLED